MVLRLVTTAFDAPKPVNEELVRDIERAVEAVVEREDAYWCENDSLGDYFDGTDRDEMLKRFEENYSTRRVGYTDRDELDGTELLAALRTHGLNDEKIATLIQSHCDAEARDDIYTHWNDMSTVCIGEAEYQIDVADHPELADLVSQATDEELRAAGIKDRDSFLAYGRPCELVALKLDAETFLDAANEILGPESSQADSDSDSEG